MADLFSCHIFAHDEGRYRTVVAHGVSDSETRLLEQFFYGQTADPEYLASLEREPGVIWRRLGARIALTRVRQGARDANGRATFRFETLVGDPTDTRLCTKVGELCTGKWSVSDAGAVVVPSPETQRGPVNAEQISDVVMAVRNGSRVVRRAARFTLSDVSRIIKVSADIPGFSLSYKSLNKEVPVSVNLVSLAVSEVVKVSSTQTVGSPPPRTSRSSAHRASREFPMSLIFGAICVVLALQVLVLWRITRPRTSASESTTQEHILTRIEAKAKESAERDASITTDVKEFIDSQRRQLEEGLRESITAKVDQRVSELESRLEETKKELDAGGHTLRSKIADLGKKVDEVKSDVEDVNESLNGLQETIDAVSSDIKSLKVDKAEQDDDSESQEATDPRGGQR